MVTREEFITTIREKYPTYKSVGDDELYEKITTKYPQYKAQISEAPAANMSTVDGAKFAPPPTGANMSTVNGPKKAPAPVVPPKTEAPTTFGGKFQEITQRRGEKMAANTAQRKAGDITVGEEAARGLGQGIATLGEVAFTGALSLVKAIPGVEGTAKFTIENQPTIVKRGFTAAFGAIQKGAEAYEDWKNASKTNMRIAEDLEAVVNIGLGVTGASGSKQAASQLSKRGKDVFRASKVGDFSIPNALKNVEKIPEELASAGTSYVRNSMTKDYQNLFNSTKPLSRQYQNIRATKKLDPVELLIDKKIFPDVEQGVYKTENAVSNLEDEVSILSGIRREMLESSGEYVDLAEVRTRALKAANSETNRSQNLVKEMRSEINREIDEYIETYGERIPLAVLSDIKIGQRIKSKAFKKASFFTGRTGNSHYELSDVARIMVEEKAGKGVMGEFNRLIGQHLDAIDLLESVQGQKVKGGLFRRAMLTLTGGTIGAAGLGTTFGGIAGAVAGNYLVSILQYTGISNPLKQMILQRAAAKDPKAYEAALQYIKANKLEREMMPLLPAGAIQLPAQQGKSGVQSIPAPKGEPGRTPKGQEGGGQFFKTYLSDTQPNTNKSVIPPTKSSPAGVDSKTNDITTTDKASSATEINRSIDESVPNGKPQVNRAFGGFTGLQPETDENGNITGFSFDPAAAAVGAAAMGLGTKNVAKAFDYKAFFKKEPPYGVLEDMKAFNRYFDFQEVPKGEKDVQKWLAGVRDVGEKYGIDAGMTDLQRARLYTEILNKADAEPKYKRNPDTGRFEGNKKKE